LRSRLIFTEKENSVNERHVEKVLEPLCSVFSSEADALLDIRDCLLRKEAPGRCVDCYYRLMERADAGNQKELGRLRECLESEVEVVAQDERKQLLERVPLRLETGDLQSYCEWMMQAFVQDRSYEAERIELCFQFKDRLAIA
jgi:hypothetical protein